MKGSELEEGRKAMEKEVEVRNMKGVRTEEESENGREEREREWMDKK